MLPTPTFSFTIGSVHDNTPLDCRIYHPARWSLSESHLESPWTPRGAIIAHPYTALGGCYDDGVVLSAVSEILKAGFVAGTFNFRGAGSSKGRSSWTGKPELLDYISFIGLFVYYLSGLRPPPPNNDSHEHHRTTHALLSPSPGGVAPLLPPPPPPLGITLILGGYSYGSLLTTYLPTAGVLLDRFARASDGTAEARIKSEALALAARWNQSASTVPHPGRISMGGEACGRSASRQRTSGESSGGKHLDSVIRQSLERSKQRFRSWRSAGDGPGGQSRPSTAGEGEREVEGGAMAESSIDHDDHKQNIVLVSQVCYLLISPLLPPISLFATMFSKPHDDHHHHHHHHHHHRHQEDHEQFSSRSAAAASLPPNPLSPSSSSPSAPPLSPLNYTPLSLSSQSHQTSTSTSTSPSTSNLTTHPTLAIYGTRDFFSSHRKLRAWAENLAAQPGSLFRFREVHGAGHFWQEREREFQVGQEGGQEGGDVGVERELRRGVKEWLLVVVMGGGAGGEGGCGADRPRDGEEGV